MPELPEVETARRNIDLALVGKRVRAARCSLPKLLRDSPIRELSVIDGHQLLAVDRRAKVLSLHFDGDLSLLIHLKLSGQLAIVRPDGSRLVAGHPVPLPAGELPHKATHAIIRFDDDSIAYLSDIRQFGWLRMMPKQDVEVTLATFGFGPEGTEVLDTGVLGDVMRRRTVPIKTLLLDQTFVAGLGNIYADEVLFRARVYPALPANALTASQREALLTAVPPVLAEGIRQGGAKIINHRAIPDHEFPAVHGRAGEPCFACGTAIVKTKVGTRSTYLCPNCQRVAGTKRPQPGLDPVRAESPSSAKWCGRTWQ